MARVSAEERRRQLVAAAFRVIGRDGFAGVTTRRVCAEAGAPLAAFHYCFASKQELLAELTTQTMAALMSAQHEMPLRERSRPRCGRSCGATGGPSRTTPTGSRC